MKILLLAPPWGELYGSYRRLTRSLNLNPPLNLAYLAASLIEAGHKVKILDLEFYPRTRAVIEQTYLEFGPDITGITTTSPVFPAVSRIAEILSDLGSRVILGGPHVSLMRAQIFTDCPKVDFLLAGEAEKTLPRLLDQIVNGTEPDVEGLVLRGETDHEKDKLPPLVDDLDAIPDPAYPGIDFNQYTWSVKARGKKPARTITSSRGCPYQCVFCSINRLTGRKVRFRSPERVAREIEQAVSSSPVRHIVFVDDVLTQNKKHIRKIAELLASKNLPVTWEGDTRADAVDAQTLKLMARAGCTRINFGIESGDETILRGLNKKLDLRQVMEAFRWAKEAGMDTRGTAMIGNPGDTRETMKKTVRFLRNLHWLDQPYLSIAQPYPGTELRRIALSGESNLRIIPTRLDEMRRYGSAVMHVGDVSPDEMVRIQRNALLKLYLTPRRIWYNIMRSNIFDGLAMALGFCISLFSSTRKQENSSEAFQ